MQRRRDDVEGKRPRITVSLDPEDYEWVQTFEGSSDSYKIAKIIKAARDAGVTAETASAGGTIPELVEWLSTKRSQSARDLHKLLSEFLGER
jgi:molybdenum cofactor biosynthesis enzyme MoaA